MRKKIEVTSNEWRDAETPQSPAQDGDAPEFGDHINPIDAVPGAPTETKKAATVDGAEAYIVALQADLDDARREIEDLKKHGHRTHPVDGEEAYIVALQADLDDARRQIDELKKQVLYSHAEFQNFRRRKEEEQKELAKFANAEMIRSLLPILDNFDRALQAAEQTRNFDALIGGVSGTSKQLQSFLQKAGVSPIEALGKDFDPNFHEAIGHSDDPNYSANTVAEEVQRGYLMHDKVLRPALVRVAQG